MKAPLSTNHLVQVVSSMRTLSLAVVHSVHAEWLGLDSISLFREGIELQGPMGVRVARRRHSGHASLVAQRMRQFESNAHSPIQGH